MSQLNSGPKAVLTSLLRLLYSIYRYADCRSRPPNTTHSHILSSAMRYVYTVETHWNFCQLWVRQNGYMEGLDCDVYSNLCVICELNFYIHCAMSIVVRVAGIVVVGPSSSASACRNNFLLPCLYSFPCKRDPSPSVTVTSQLVFLPHRSIRTSRFKL